ncbi:MAG: acyl carrier protein [Bacteroidia bacterium]
MTLIMAELNDILATVFEIDASKLTDEKTWNDIPNWDSLRQMVLISAIEEAYKFELTFDEIAEMNSIGNIRKVVSAKLN